MSVKKLILVDDHAIVRNGLKELIEKLGPFEVAQQYSNGKELADNKSSWLDAHLIILDLEMSVMDGRETLKWLKQENVNTPVLILTFTDDENQITPLFRLGARGYLHKNCSADNLKLAINDILTTGFYHSEMLTKVLQSGLELKDADDDIRLNDQHLLFLKLVCDEKEFTYDQIANIMHLSRRTIDGYRETLFQKFKLRSKTGLVLFAIKNKLI